MSIRQLLYTESRLQGIPWTTVCRRAGISRQVADYQLARRKPGPTLDLCLRLAKILHLNRRSIERIWRDEVLSQARRAEGWSLPSTTSEDSKR